MQRTTDGKYRIRIKLDDQPLLADYVEEVQRWEGEGGNSARLNDLLKEISHPLRKGEVFEVLGGELVSEKGSLYYDADIELLALSDEDE